MKKLLFILMMLFAANLVFSQAAATATPEPDDDIKAQLQQNEDFFAEFQQRFKTAKAYDSSRASRETLKQMQDMLDRQRKLIEFKMEEIRVMQSGGKEVPIKNYTQLQELMNRYQQMTVEMANWTNGKK